MSDLTRMQEWVHDVLPAALARWDVPAAAVAVSIGDSTFTSVAGITNSTTGVPASSDTLFQIGSITKVWTATLVMQLVEEGEVELDAPVRRYLPDLHLADEDATAAITIRQLLCHTAGFEGDVFTDTGSNEDALARYVESLHDTPQLVAPGAMFSYNNAGYCVLGRVVEVLRGVPFEQCLRDRLFKPLGLRHVANSAEEAIMMLAAVGHVSGGQNGAQQPAPIWAMARSNAPAGSQLTMSAGDLLTFARMHLHGDVIADGERLLTAATVRAMQHPQVNVPDLGVMGDTWGLGWEIYDVDGVTLVGHDGNTVGQASFLRMCPERDVAVVLLTNGGQAAPLFQAVVGELLRDSMGVALPPFPTPPREPVPFDTDYFVGTYSASVADLVVSADMDGRVWLEQRPRGEQTPGLDSAERYELVGYREDSLIPREPQSGLHIPHVFLGNDGHGRAEYLHVGRAVPRAVPAH